MVTANRGSQQLDSQGTPRYATFNSTKVLICGYPEADAGALSKAIEQEGGKVLKKYYKGSRPDVIVCGTVADRNCKEARKAWQDAVPVVTRDWVGACTKQKAQVSFGPYKLGALVGLEISATNFQQKERMLLQKLVQSAGGTYSAELFKGRTTHLMCKNGTGKKYSAAVQWRSVHVVTDAWLRDSVALGYPAPETNYKVDPVLEARQNPQTTQQPAAAPAAAVPQAQAISESVMFGGPADNRTASTATDKQQQAAEAQQQQQEASSKSNAKRPAASIKQQAASSKPRRSSQRLSQPPASSAEQEAVAAAAAAAAAGAAGAAAAAAAAAHPAAAAAAHADALQAAAAAAAQVQPVNSTDSRLAALGLTDAEAAPMFLERVVLWWCGIPEGSSEHKELQAILHAYAGVRFPDMHDITTHIMIGKHAKVEELKAVQQYLGSCNRRVEVVSVAWLELCHEEQRCVPVDARCRLQLASLMRGGSSHPLGAAGAGALGSGGAGAGLAAGGASCGGGVFADTASRGGFTEAADRQQQDAAGLAGGWVPEFWHEQPTDPLKLFDGCYFTLAAVQSHQADHEKALGYIRRLGGKVFTADSTKPPPRWPKVFAVCPASLTWEAEASLVAADASFRLVHPSCRVTTHWMDICVKHSQLVRVTPRNPLLSPLRFALPLRDFANVSIAVTGYKEGQRSTIEKLVVLLGGSFCKTLGRQQRPTHLMLPRWGPDSAAAGGGADAAAVDGSADGTGSATQQQQLLPESTVKKIAYAMKHRVKMVVSEWLLDCAAEGRRVQEGLHRPEGDLSLLELPAGGCATQAGGGATQLPATQLPKTQQTQAADSLGSSRQPPAPASTRSLASLLSGQAPLPRPPPSGSRIVAAAAATTITAPTSSTAAAPAAAVADGSDAAAVAAAVATPAPAKPSNWFTANLVNSSSRAATQQQPPPQQQQQDVQGQQQQQQDSKQPPYDKAATPPQQPAAQQQQQPSVTPGRSSRKRSAAAAAAAANAAAPPAPPSDQAGGAAAAAAAAVVQEGEALDVAPQQHKRQCKQQQPQQQGVPQQPQGDVGRDAGAAAVAAAVAVVAAATAGGKAGGATAAAAVEAGTDGQHDAALTDVLSMLATFSNKEAANVPASQAMAGDILQLPDTLLSAGRVGSGGCCGSGAAGPVGSGGGGGGSGGVQSGGVGQGTRGRRRAGGLGRAASGREASGAVDSLEGAAAGAGELGGGGAGSGGAQQAGWAKRMRRSSGCDAKSAAGSSGTAAAGGEGPLGQGGSSSAGSASMLPPARKAVGVGGALAAPSAAAAQGAGGSRYGTHRGSAGGAAAPTDVSFEPSQQVGYDIGDTPETLLGAGSRGGQRRTAADDAQKQAHMLARLSSLRSRS